MIAHFTNIIGVEQVKLPGYPPILDSLALWSNAMRDFILACVYPLILGEGSSPQPDPPNAHLPGLDLRPHGPVIKT